jgi:hypothetical protein
VGFPGEDAVERGKPRRPERLIERQPPVGFGEARRLQLAVVVPATHVAAHEAGPLEDTHVLRRRFERHVVRFAELADCALANSKPAQHVTPRAVGQSAEHFVQHGGVGFRGRRPRLSFNH